MFHNIGGKIKGLAQLVCYMGIGCSLLAGFILVLNGRDMFIAAGVLLAALGSLISWVSSFTVYGFGQLVENSDILAGRMQGSVPDAAAPAASEPGTKKAKEPRPVPRDAIIFPTRTEAEMKCPKCGCTQIGYRDLCRSCKEPFFCKDELE